jgi:hypothetical protein
MERQNKTIISISMFSSANTAKQVARTKNISCRTPSDVVHILSLYAENNLCKFKTQKILVAPPWFRYPLSSLCLGVPISIRFCIQVMKDTIFEKLSTFNDAETKI